MITCKIQHTLFAALLLAPLAGLHAAALKLASPLDYQVVQRVAASKGRLRITGELSAAGTNGTAVEVRIHFGTPSDWIKLPSKFDGARFSAETDAPAGGWYRVELLVLSGEGLRVHAAKWTEKISLWLERQLK